MCTLPVDSKYIPLLPEFKLCMVVAPKCLSNGFKFKGDNSFSYDCNFTVGFYRLYVVDCFYVGALLSALKQTHCTLVWDSKWVTVAFYHVFLNRQRMTFCTDISNDIPMVVKKMSGEASHFLSKIHSCHWCVCLVAKTVLNYFWLY